MLKLKIEFGALYNNVEQFRSYYRDILVQTKDLDFCIGLCSRNAFHA